MKTGNDLRNLRKKFRLRQEDIAGLLGTSKFTIARREALGDEPLPLWESLGLEKLEERLNEHMRWRIVAGV